MGHHLCRWKTIRRWICCVRYRPSLQTLFASLCTCACQISDLLISLSVRCLRSLPPEEAKHPSSHSGLGLFGLLRISRDNLRHLARRAAPPVACILLIDVLYFLVRSIKILGRLIIWHSQYHIAIVLVALLLIVRQVDIRIWRIIVLATWVDSHSVCLDLIFVVLSIPSFGSVNRHLLVYMTMFHGKLPRWLCCSSVGPASITILPATFRIDRFMIIIGVLMRAMSLLE